MERSSDIIKMHAYAPLFVNVSTGARSQANNLIGYDAMTSYGSPSYWAQVMFSNNRGDVELPVDMSSGMAPVDTPHGSVGVGTWATQAEFKDVKVTHGDSVLYEGNLSNADGDWTITHGDWKVSGHVLSQKSVDTGCYTTVGTPMSTPAWTDYSYTLKARKTGGEEGFQILFHARDKDDFIWWNIGGWGNTRTQLQRLDHGQTSDFGPTSPVTVETGRWYDIRVDVSGSSIRCYLDGQLIASSTDTAPPAPKPLYAAASRDKATGDVILKIDNVAATPQYIAINLQGVSTVEPKISGQIMAGKPDDENSIAEPENIAPHSISIAGGRQFTYDCPAYSVTVLRVKTK